jgi:hypothetical protein
MKMTELNIGDMRFTKSEHGWYDHLQVWTGTEWRDCDPITPPPELVRQWLLEYYGGDLGEVGPDEMYIAKCGAQWGYEKHEKALLDAMHSIELQPYESDND